MAFSRIPNTRRLARISVHPELLGAMFRSGECHFRLTGVPDSARFETAIFDSSRFTFEIYFSDDSFEEVPEGNIIPQLNVISERLACGQ